MNLLQRHYFVHSSCALQLRKQPIGQVRKFVMVAPGGPCLPSTDDGWGSAHGADCSQKGAWEGCSDDWSLQWIDCQCDDQSGVLMYAEEESSSAKHSEHGYQGHGIAQTDEKLGQVEVACEQHDSQPAQI